MILIAQKNRRKNRLGNNAQGEDVNDELSVEFK